MKSDPVAYLVLLKSKDIFLNTTKCLLYLLSTVWNWLGSLQNCQQNCEMQIKAD